MKPALALILTSSLAAAVVSSAAEKPAPVVMEAKIVGKWVPDVEPPKKGTTKNADDFLKLAFGGDIEFKADHTVIDNTPMTPITLGKWKTVATKGDTKVLSVTTRATVTFSFDAAADAVWVTQHATSTA